MTKELTFRTSRRWPGRDCFGLGVEASPAQCTNLPSLRSPLLSRRWIWFRIRFLFSCTHTCKLCAIKRILIQDRLAGLEKNVRGLEPAQAHGYSGELETATSAILS